MEMKLVNPKLLLPKNTVSIIPKTFAGVEAAYLVVFGAGWIAFI